MQSFFFSVTFAFVKTWISVYTFYILIRIYLPIHVELYIPVYKESFSLFISIVQIIVHQSRCYSIILIGNLVHKNVIIPFGIWRNRCIFPRKKQKVLDEHRKKLLLFPTNWYLKALSLPQFVFYSVCWKNTNQICSSPVTPVRTVDAQ